MKPPFTVYHVALAYGRMFNGRPVFISASAGFPREGVEPLMDEEVYEEAEKQVRGRWADLLSKNPELGNNYSDWHQMWGRSYTTTIFK